MALPPGSLGYIDYGEAPRVIHARVILDHVINMQHVVLTPVHDIYMEDFDVSTNDDIVQF